MKVISHATTHELNLKEVNQETVTIVWQCMTLCEPGSLALYRSKVQSTIIIIYNSEGQSAQSAFVKPYECTLLAIVQEKA